MKRLFSTIVSFKNTSFLRDLERETLERYAQKSFIVHEVTEYMQAMNRNSRNIESGTTVTKCLKIAHNCVDQVNQKVGKRLDESEINLRRESKKYIDRFQRMMLSNNRSQWYALVYKQMMSQAKQDVNSSNEHPLKAIGKFIIQ